ncbi:MAG: ScnB [Actinomycetota bacterium]|nr:ScnB [Actinomycetota bacterium]
MIEALGPVDATPPGDPPPPWQSSLQATCDALALRGALDTVERRQAEDALGETVYRDVPTGARPAVVAAHLLMEKGIITPEELRAKMDEVRARFERTE